MGEVVDVVEGQGNHRHRSQGYRNRRHRRRRHRHRRPDVKRSARAAVAPPTVGGHVEALEEEPVAVRMVVVPPAVPVTVRAVAHRMMVVLVVVTTVARVVMRMATDGMARTTLVLPLVLVARMLPLLLRINRADQLTLTVSMAWVAMEPATWTVATAM